MATNKKNKHIREKQAEPKIHRTLNHKDEPTQQ
jgi:hypothetical protein